MFVERTRKKKNDTTKQTLVLKHHKTLMLPSLIRIFTPIPSFSLIFFSLCFFFWYHAVYFHISFSHLFSLLIRFECRAQHKIHKQSCTFAHAHTQTWYSFKIIANLLNRRRFEFNVDGRKFRRFTNDMRKKKNKTST